MARNQTYHSNSHETDSRCKTRNKSQARTIGSFCRPPPSHIFNAQIVNLVKCVDGLALNFLPLSTRVFLPGLALVLVSILVSVLISVMILDLVLLVVPLLFFNFGFSDVCWFWFQVSVLIFVLTGMFGLAFNFWILFSFLLFVLPLYLILDAATALFLVLVLLLVPVFGLGRLGITVVNLVPFRLWFVFGFSLDCNRTVGWMFYVSLFQTF